jgi:hypothetical protein
MRHLFVAIFAACIAGQISSADEFFEKKVRPLLVQQCQPCHNTKVKTSGLDMSTAEGFMQGGPSGPLASKHGSLLLDVISYEGRLKMPPGKKLPDEDIAILKTWVDNGAVWPGAVAVNPPEAAKELDRSFWSFQPMRKHAPPPVKNESWTRNSIDRFILAKLEEKGLTPAAPASRTTLLRRVTFDLTGLPPTPDEVQDFLADTAPNAYEKVVDRLLASPRYGEKWGRYWLDVARYADSTGNDEDHRYPYAWRYRDYVIDAFNRDLPYDQFLKEQIAGDLLPGNEPGQPNRRGIVATGFLALGAKAIAQQDKKKMLYDVYDEQVDVLSKTVMGVTLACARCHDHKFDPLLTKDYYSMVSIFASTKSFKDPESHVSQLLFTPLVPAAEYEKYTQHQKKVAAKNTEIEDVMDQYFESQIRPQVPRLADYMIAARMVYSAKADAADIARQKKLQPDTLAKWVKYLEPTGEAKVHLDTWRKATAETAPSVAKEYAARFEARLAEWTAELSKWRANSSAGDKPKFEPARDRFFAEVWFGGPFGIPNKKDRDKSLPEAVMARVAALRKEHSALKATSPPEPDMACAVQEGPVIDQKIFVRGDYNSLGEDAPKAFPIVIAGDDQPAITKGSGRIELAEWLTRPDHPLTARVMANRIWQWHFGEGIVRTPDNFGKMGEAPTHPELLDALAIQFVENGWSIKKLHRQILLSNTYRMSSSPTDTAIQADPENRLFSRFPRRRLTVEEVRDGLLAIDGSLDTTMGGTLQSGFGTDGENSNDRLSISPETSKRRLVYLPLRRANLPSLLNLFDFGDATTSSGKRTVTTVAPQALFMMNSSFVTARSNQLSALLMKDGADGPSRLRSLYLRVLNREPNAMEIDSGLTYLTSFTEKFSGKRTEADAWFSLARVLIASNEFIYVD